MARLVTSPACASPSPAPPFQNNGNLVNFPFILIVANLMPSQKKGAGFPVLTATDHDQKVCFPLIRHNMRVRSYVRGLGAGQQDQGKFCGGTGEIKITEVTAGQQGSR
jgi:hypothetical protein